MSEWLDLESRLSNVDHFFYAIDLDFDIILWLLCNKMLYPFVWPKVYQELRVYVSGQENMYSVEV